MIAKSSLQSAKAPCDCSLERSCSSRHSQSNEGKLHAGRVKLIGFDSSIYEIQLLEEGTLKALVVQKPFNMGYLGVKTALQLVNRDNPEQRHTYTDSTVVTRENMYTPENQKLLFPFIGN